MTDVLQIASAKLAANPKGELVLPERKRFWHALGDRLMKGNRAVKGFGLSRRTKLATLCAQKVTGLWDEVWPGNTGPSQMLSTAEAYLRDSLDFDSAWKRKNSFWGDLDNLLCEGNHLTVVNVGFAAANVVTTSLVDERFDPQNLEEDILDDALDPYEWDAGFYASAAYSEGFSREEQSNRSRRREFWEWYLIEAVPSSWDLT